MIKKEFFKYLIAGISAFIIEYYIFIFLIKTFPNIKYIYNISQTVSMLVGASVSFSINKLWSFNAKNKTVSQLIKYIAVFIFNLVATNILIILINNFNIISNPAIIKIILVGMITIWNFFIYKIFVFKK